MHFCSPSFRLSKAPKISAIPASGNSEKHVALQKALAELKANAPPSIDSDLHPEYLLLSRPFLPRPWLTSGRKTLDPEREFPRRGKVNLPHE
jgi:hypothetical protein